MAYDSDNVFAKILRKEIPANIIFEDDFCLAFRDVAPQAPLHVLLIPKVEAVDFEDFHQKASDEEVLGFYSGVKRVVALLELKDGYRLISNKGSAGGQTVFHYHVHILAGKEFSEKMVLTK